MMNTKNISALMRKTLYGMMIFAVILAAFGGGSVKPVQAQAAQPSLTVSLSADKTSFGAAENVILHVTIANNGGEAVKILKWVTPSEGADPLLNVTVDGNPVAYTGAIYKRVPPTEQSYVSIAAGASLSGDINLGSFYNLSAAGNYSATYNVASESLFWDETKAMPFAGSLSSSALSVYVEAHEVAQPVTPQGDLSAQAGTITFDTSCTAAEQTLLLASRTGAYNYSTDAVNYFNNGQQGARYVTWFGVYNATRYNTAKTHFINIKSYADTHSIKFNCADRDSGIYAYVYPNDPYNIWVCGAFWGSPTTGTDSKSGTLVHEMSHFDINGGTDDFVYGQSLSKDLAKNTPANAVMNADNHEYFVENNPSLETTNPPVVTYTISGNAGIAGATLSYTDVTAKTATADGSGNYSFSVSSGWSGTATPTKLGYTFNPTSKSYSGVVTNQTAQNYTAATVPVTYIISGNAGVAGATLSYADVTAKTATADVSGNYSFTVSSGWNGTVTPTKSGYAFNPTSKSYSNVAANQTAQNYVATPVAVTYTISGSAGVAGATLSYNDGTAKTVTADANGTYSFSVPAGTSPTVTPSKSGYAFSPISRSYPSIAANQTAQNYVATVIGLSNDDFTTTPTLIGSLPYSITQSTTAATTAADDQTFTCVSTKGYNTVWYRYVPGASQSITVDTIGSGYDTILGIWTGSRGSLTSVGCNDDISGTLQSKVTFAGTAGVAYYIEVASYGSGGGSLKLNATGVTTLYTISGSAGIAGATLSYNDGSARTATADANGNYSFTVPAGASFTVTPSKAGYAFSPVSKSYSSVAANQTAQNYVAAVVVNAYTISGNAGIAGATLSYTDGTAKTATADASGNYFFTVASGWNGNVTPSKSGYSFSPTYLPYSNVTTNQTAQNYVATVVIPAGTNLLLDPSFEAYKTSSPWTQASTNFGSPLCTVTDCGNDGGIAGPRTNAVWSWFGGVTANETGSLSQSVVFPNGTATLSFYLWIGSAAAGSDASDLFAVNIDGTQVFSANATQASSYPAYTLVTVDASAFANGASHTVTFSSTTTGQAVTFNLDDVSLTGDGGVTPPPVTTQTAVFSSYGANDGWLLEYSETSNRGGAINATATYIIIGDDAYDRQVRSLLHFNTATLPDNAVITSVQLKLNKQGVLGTDPFATHGDLIVEIQKPFVGTTAALQVADFQSATSLQNVTPFTSTVDNWYSALLGAANNAYVNLLGTTQFRLRFTLDDNDDRGGDYVKFFSGNYATASLRPQLIVEYYVP